jgi:hypothetical protein
MLLSMPIKQSFPTRRQSIDYRTNPTTFFDLICETPSTTKKQTLDANVDGTLTLNNNELATDAFRMTVFNPSSAAIVVNGVNDAFVSSTGVGKLVRKTNSTDEYLFPLGWNNSGLILKREASFTPIDASNHSYEARFALILVYYHHYR